MKHRGTPDDIETQEIRRIGNLGWAESVNGGPGYMEESVWRDYAPNLPTIEVDRVGANEVVLCSYGGAEVIVHGDVGPGAIILCSGGGASVTIYGDIYADVRIMAQGGGAQVLYGSDVHPTARLNARGGAAVVRPLERLDFYDPKR